MPLRATKTMARVNARHSAETRTRRRLRFEEESASTSKVNEIIAAG